AFGADAIPYEVRNLRLVLLSDSGRTASGQPWAGARPLTLQLAQPSQPYALEISVADPAQGVLHATARLAGGGRVALCEPVDLGALGTGRHLLPVHEGLPAAVAVELA